MSKIKLPHASGNSMSIGAPATNPASDLELKLPATIGTAGQFLTVDGLGNLVWANPPGITHYDCWRLTTNSTDEDEDPLGSVTAIERAIDANGNKPGFGTFGAPMTQSGGIFSFPTTGYWKVEFQVVMNCADESYNNNTSIKVTTDGGTTWEPLSSSQGSVSDDGANNVYGSNYCSLVIDVTNVSNVKVKFSIMQQDGDATILGQSEYNRTCMMFTRLGDT